MKVKFENVKVEEAIGQVSAKDASKYYGSVVLKQKDADTNLNTSIPLQINSCQMIEVLQKYEVNEDVLNIVVNLEKNKFDPKTCILRDIISLDVVA